MRLHIAFLTALGLFVGPAYATSQNLEQTQPVFGKARYCRGETVPMFSLHFIIKMDDDEAVAMMERISNKDITCALLSPRDMHFTETFNVNKPGYRFILNQFRDDNNVTWYQWKYKQ